MKKNPFRDAEQGLRNTAARMDSAVRNFIGVLMKFGGITEEEARKVLAIYRKHKVIKSDAVNGVINVKHGAFLEREVIRNTLKEN